MLENWNKTLKQILDFSRGVSQKAKGPLPWPEPVHHFNWTGDRGCHNNFALEPSSLSLAEGSSIWDETAEQLRPRFWPHCWAVTLRSHLYASLVYRLKVISLTSPRHWPAKCEPFFLSLKWTCTSIILITHTELHSQELGFFQESSSKCFYHR